MRQGTRREGSNDTESSNSVMDDAVAPGATGQNEDEAMTFKELKAGHVVHVLHKDKVRYGQGKVVSVSQPRYQAQNGGLMGYNQTSPQVVDVTIEEGGEQKTYTIPETLEVTYASGIVIATSRENILTEVDSIMARAEEQIANIDKNREIVARCEKVKSEIDPAIREKQKTEERFNALESKIGSLASMIEKLVNKS